MRDIEYQIFHARVGQLLSGLAGQHHEHYPFDLFQIQLLGVQGQQPVDHDFALTGREDAAGLERGEQAAAQCRSRRTSSSGA